MKRPARIVAETLCVLCPHCGAEQPNPDNGGDAWLPREVHEKQGDMTCVSCDAAFRLYPQNRVSVSAS